MQFAQVEQQLRSNDQLETLVALQKSTQASAALDFVGKTVVISGAHDASGCRGHHRLDFQLTEARQRDGHDPGLHGQTAFSSTYAINSGRQDFVWDGRGTNGQRWPAGNYTMSITAKDANGQTVAITTDVQGIVDSADLSQTPPVLSIGELTFTLDQIKRVVRPVCRCRERRGVSIHGQIVNIRAWDARLDGRKTSNGVDIRLDDKTAIFPN